MRIHYVIMSLRSKKILVIFTKRALKSTNLDFNARFVKIQTFKKLSLKALGKWNELVVN
jgi:hypothetical protein